jgi:hypothetical protein
MAETAGEGRTWAWIGKASVLVGLILALGTLFSRCTAPTIGLRATIERGSLNVPPRYAKFQDDVTATLKSDNIELVLKELADGQKDKEAPSLTLVSALSEKLREQVKLDQLDREKSYTNYSAVDIVNTGGLPVKEVSLRLPGSRMAIIEKEDGTKTTDETGPIIEVGTVGAGQKVKVVAWSDVFSLLSMDEPELFHANGPGSISIKGEPTFGEFLSENSFPLITITIVLLILFFAAIDITRHFTKKSYEKK